MTKKNADGFVQRTFTGQFRKNGKWIQVKTVIDGKERYFLMQEVPSLRGLAQDKELPFPGEAKQ